MLLPTHYRSNGRRVFDPTQAEHFRGYRLPPRTLFYDEISIFIAELSGSDNCGVSDLSAGVRLQRISLLLSSLLRPDNRSRVLERI
jgi:hypothetical protein